jgi:hypothetical protein
MGLPKPQSVPSGKNPRSLLNQVLLEGPVQARECGGWPLRHVPLVARLPPGMVLRGTAVVKALVSFHEPCDGALDHGPLAFVVGLKAVSEPMRVRVRRAPLTR